MTVSNATRITQDSDTLAAVADGARGAAEQLSESTRGLAAAIPDDAFGLAGGMIARAGNDVAAQIGDSTRALARFVERVSTGTGDVNAKFTELERESAERFAAIEGMLG